MCSASEIKGFPFMGIAGIAGYPCLVVVIILLLVSPVSASAPDSADRALDFVRTSVDQVLTILRDPAFEEQSAKEEQRRKLRALVDTLFDYDEISKRTLGRNRKEFTPEQMDEFVQLFSKLMEKIYMDKIRSYHEEKIVYGKSILLSKNKAEVETEVITASKEIPIKYRLIIKNGQWKGYDVLVEGVSLVKNYRSQFNQILRDKAPEDLLQQLREKINKQEDLTARGPDKVSRSAQQDKKKI